MVDEIRAGMRDVDPDELDATIAGAVLAVKKVTAKKLKARQKK